MTDIKKGLAGVVVDRTAISKVNPETNSLLYRGYPVQELAATQSFEAVAYLLWNGELPTDAQLADLRALERESRPLQPDVKAAIDLLPVSAHPMDEVRTAVSVIGARDTAGIANVMAAVGTPEENLQRSIRLFGELPAIVAYGQRRRRGLEPLESRDDLDYAANFLWLTFGPSAGSGPSTGSGTGADALDPVVVDAFNRSMILYAEHSFNASTFTARVITSTLSDLYSAVVGAIGALKGPLHGGANEAVLHIFEEIGSAENVVPWLDAALADKRKIMGFGHRVYKRGDSRVPTMKAALDTLVAHYDRPDVAELYDRLEAEFVGRKGIYPNLDYPSGPAYSLIGFDTLTFTPLFVAARVTGWTAHIMEQQASNALIRPLSEYDGPDERHVAGYVPDAAEAEVAERAEEAAG
jgi:citrate synthase